MTRPAASGGRRSRGWWRNDCGALCPAAGKAGATADRGNGRQRGRRAGVKSSRIVFPPIPSKAILGDCRAALPEFPPDSAQLVLTSPPYYNARPEYAEYVDYRAYLNALGEAFAACYDVLAEGRFLIVNISPVLVRRTGAQCGQPATADTL